MSSFKSRSVGEVTRQRRRRSAATAGRLGWSVAAGLALALLFSIWMGFATERRLRAELAAAKAQSATAGRSLAVCEAKAVSLQNTLDVLSRPAEAVKPGTPLSAAALLARQAVGADACARAYEAEALVREATQ